MTESTFRPVSKEDLLRLLRPHARSADFEIAIGRGWWPIVADCHRRLVARLPHYELLAVKQKYGTLAFQAFASRWKPGIAWTEADVQALDAIVEAAREFSARTCETCGEAGAMRTIGKRLKTLCEACLAGETGLGRDGVTT